MEDALDTARVKLIKTQSVWEKFIKRKSDEKIPGKHQRHGFIDMLDFISGLINYEHPSFIDKDLDIIEEFVDGIEEYSFQIAGKINSARSYRLTN